MTAAQAADLHAALNLNSLPKSFSSQLSQYAQLSSLPQFAGSQQQAMAAAAFGLPQTPSFATSSKERSAVLSHDRDILSRDRDRDRDHYSRDRELYNKVLNIQQFLKKCFDYSIFYSKCMTTLAVSTLRVSQLGHL